uniref:Transmembrane protein 186 n=1 Tax=Loa loa TaxID=7209 RepID=A0A1I7VV04_LOALO
MAIQLHSESAQDSNKVPSPGGFNLRLTVPKKHYSVQRNDSLQFIITPVFDKAMIQKKTPSSPATVLTVAGLFVVGITLVLSGIIVLCQQSEQPFRICGSLFISFGLSMLLACAVLQRKNIIKFVEDLNQDLYFFSMSDNYMWKLMFVNRNELPEPHEG